MIKEKNLLKMLFNKENNNISTNASYELNNIYHKLLFMIITLCMIIGLFINLNEIFFSFNLTFSFNDYASFIIGNACTYGCFKAIKKHIIIYYINNPLFIIGLIYPSFFFTSLLNQLFNIDLKYSLSLIMIFILIYYLILNKYYQYIINNKEKGV
ncbi:MAG: hypothetical protein LBT75_05120 [Bacilli bacterium]|jgi:hypothetical protein|nr:hypothetical protein [Bacilli bacterium]